jgi:phosphopantothenoylcysteine decarboxylase/phosphopantothenate--cysteine ligase
MGFRIAERGARRGASVTLIAGPVSRATPAGVTRVDVVDAREMQRAVTAALGDDLSGADALVMAAAVADFRPATPSVEKVKRGDGGLTLELVPNPDILAGIGAARTGAAPVLVGFALETAEGKALVALAREKLEKKRVDLVVANSAAVALGGEDSQATLVSATNARDLGPRSKAEIADAILDFIRDRRVLRA